ncbi:MAG: heparan-alpha-glucosaminide N-acetyltransferase domain-containing protein [Vicinamibacterales bacterium]
MAEPPAGHRVHDVVRGHPLTRRKTYLDAARGLAVAIMVLAHVTDAFTREADRADDRYFTAVFINGLAAPMFLFLAGVALTMAAESRSRTIGRTDAGRSILRRGWQVFGLAFLFRAQSQLLGWGPWRNFLKVDILNVMGLAMVGAAAIWRVVPARSGRIAVYAIATGLFAMLNPLVRDWVWVDGLPEWLGAYVRSIPGRTSFSLFPWAGFLTAGALLGELVDAARTPVLERRLHATLAVVALGAVGASIALSYLPPIYADTEFWSTSPAFFFIRLGLVAATIPLAWVTAVSWEPIVTLGRSSLFVYWIHVEMVYGSATIPLRRTMPYELAVVVALMLCALLYKLVHVKNAWMTRRALPRPLGFLAPVLK